MSFDLKIVNRNTKVVDQPIIENPQVRQQQVSPTPNTVEKTLIENEKQTQWDTSGWDDCVYTNDDYMAYKLSVEEEEEQLETEMEKKDKNQENIRRAEEEAYISEVTANMSEEEKARWIDDYYFNKIDMITQKYHMLLQMGQMGMFSDEEELSRDSEYYYPY
jgi:hypothetical protein